MHLQQTTYSVFLPVAVHGRWSGWSPARIDHCSCRGKARQYRTCTNPRPSCGGNSCPGSCVQHVNCDECKCNNGGCDQICEETDEGYSCSCLPGYKSIGSSCIGMWILRLDGCNQVSLAIPWNEKGLVRPWGSKITARAKITVRANNLVKRMDGWTLGERVSKIDFLLSVLGIQRRNYKTIGLLCTGFKSRRLPS